MPRYNPNPAALQATIPVLPPDTYEFVIGEPKSFAGQNRKKEDNWGIRVSLLVVSPGPQQGKRIPVTLWMHSDGAQQMSKPFQMAAYGYTIDGDGEEAFNAEMGAEDWSYNTDDGSVGEAWAQMKGRRIIGELDINMGEGDNAGKQYQAFNRWHPVQG